VKKENMSKNGKKYNNKTCEPKLQMQLV